MEESKRRWKKECDLQEMKGVDFMNLNPRAKVSVSSPSLLCHIFFYYNSFTYKAPV